MHEYNHTITGNETASFLAGKVIKSVKNETSGVVWNYTTITKVRKYKIAGGTVTTFKPNFLGLIVFSIAVGIVLGQMGENASTFIEFAATLNEVIMKLVILVMW